MLTLLRLRSCLVFSLAVCCVLAPANASAQGGPVEWNRRGEQISILPSSAVPGTYDLYLRWVAESEETTAPRDLSVEMDWFVNGLMVATTSQTAITNFAISCGPPCNPSSTPCPRRPVPRTSARSTTAASGRALRTRFRASHRSSTPREPSATSARLTLALACSGRLPSKHPPSRLWTRS